MRTPIYTNMDALTFLIRIGYADKINPEKTTRYSYILLTSGVGNNIGLKEI